MHHSSYYSSVSRLQPASRGSRWANPLRKKRRRPGLQLALVAHEIGDPNEHVHRDEDATHKQQRHARLAEADLVPAAGGTTIGGSELNVLGFRILGIRA